MPKANPKTQWGSVLNRANHVEKYLRWFVEFCPVPIAMFDRNLHYILVSQPWVKTLGIPRLKLIGTSLYESLPKAIAHRHGLERCLSGGQMHYTAEIEIAIRGESASNFQWDVQPWYTDDGAAGGIIVACHPLAESQTALLKDRLAEEIAERQYLEDAFTKIGTALEQQFQIQKVANNTDISN